MIERPEPIIAALTRRFRSIVCDAVFPRVHRFGLWLVELTAPGPDPDKVQSVCEPCIITKIQETVTEPIADRTPEVEKIVAPVQAEFENHVSQAAFNELITELNSVNSSRSLREIEIGAVCNVLQAIERQLQEVNKDVESSVTGVCLGFQGMAHRAQSAIKAAESAVVPASSTDDGDLISKMRTAVSKLVLSIQQSSNFSNSLSDKLDKLEQRLTAVQKTLKDVEALANKAKLVALNGQIEASRLGAAGAAVGVVARETKNLSIHAATTSDSIRGLVSELAKELKSTAAEIKLRTQTDAVSFAEADQLAQKLLNDIDVNHRLMLQSLGVTGQMGIELRSDIAKAVMSMQFQDRVSQCISHVIETMETMVARVSGSVPRDIRDAANERSTEWLREFATRCTMESERAALGQSELAGCAMECEVELF